MAIEVERLTAVVDVDIKRALASLTSFKSAVQSLAKDSVFKINIEYDKRSLNDLMKAQQQLKDIDIKVELHGDEEALATLNELSKDRSSEIDVEVDKSSERGVLSSFSRMIPRRPRKAKIQLEVEGEAGLLKTLTRLNNGVTYLQRVAGQGLGNSFFQSLMQLSQILNPLRYATQGLAQGFSDLNNVMGRAAIGAQNLMGTFSTTKVAWGDLMHQFKGLAKLKLPVVFSLIATVIGILPGVIAGATGAVMGLVGAFAQLGAFLAGGIIGGLGAIVAGIGSTMMGFSGVGKGVQALNAMKAPKADKSAQKAQSTADAARISAQRRIIKANEGRIQSERNLRDSLWALENAEWSLARATRAVSTAREDAAESLMQYGWAAREAVLDEADAVDALAKAQKDLEDIQLGVAKTTTSMMKQLDYFTGRTYEVATISVTAGEEEGGGGKEKAKEKAIRAVERAQLALERAQWNTVKSQKELTKAQAQGINGSDRVVDALRNERDAYRSLIQAQEAVGNAHRGIRDANQEIADATDNLADVLKNYSPDAMAASAAGLQWAQAQEDMSMAAQNFAKYLVNVWLPAWQKVKFAAQEGLLPPVQVGLEYLRARLPQVATIVGAFAATTGNAFREFMATAIGVDANFAKLEGTFTSLQPVWKNMLDAALPLHLAFTDIAGAAAPMLELFTGDVVRSFTLFSANMREMSNNGSLVEFFNESYRVTKLLWGAFVEITKTINHVVLAAMPLAGWLLEGITSHFSDLNAELSKPGGRDELTNWFNGLKPLITELSGVIGDLWQAFSGGNAQETTLTFLQTLRADVIPNLAEAFDRLNNSSIPGFVGFLLQLISGLLPPFISLLDGLIKGLEPFYPVLETIVEWLGKAFNEDTVNVIASLTPVVIAVAGALWGVVTAYRAMNLVKTVTDDISKFSNTLFDISGGKGPLASFALMLTGLPNDASALPGFFDNLTTRAWAFAAAALANPWTWVIMAIVGAIALLIANWDLIEPAIRPVLENITGAWDTFVGGFMDGINYFKPELDAVAAIFEAIGSAIENTFGTLVRNALAEINSAIKDLQEKFQPLTEKMTELFEKARPAIEVFGTIVGNVFGFIGIVVGTLAGAIGALVGAVVTGIGGALIGVIVSAFTHIGDIIGNFIDIVSGVMTFFIGLFTGDFGKMKDGVVQALGGIAMLAFNIFVGPFKLLWAFIKGFVDGVIGFFQFLMDVIVGHSIIPDMVNAIVEWFGNLFTGVIEWVSGLYTSVIAWFNNLVATWRAIFESIGNWFRDTFGPIFTVVGDTIKAVWDAIVAWFHERVATWKSIFEGIGNWFRDTFGPIFTVVGDAIKFVWDAIVAWFDERITTWRGIFEAVGNWFIGGFVWFFTSLGEGLKNIWNGIVGVVTGIWNFFSKWISTATDAIVKGVLWFFTTLGKGLKITWDDIVGAIKWIWDLFSGWISTATDNIVKGVLWFFTSLGTGAKNIFDGIINTIKNIWDGLVGIIKAPIKFAVDALNGFIDKVNDFAGNKLKIDLRIGRIELPKGFARGGILSGYTPYARGDDQLVPMRSGEGVYVSEAMKDPYERWRLTEINARALKGQRWDDLKHGAEGLAGGGLVGYAGGGRIVPNSKGSGGYIPEFWRAANQWAGETGQPVYVTGMGGPRTRAEQQVLYNRYLAGKGPLAARPGTSRHEGGKAMDLSFGSPTASRGPRDTKWGPLVRKYNMGWTVPSEDWHLQWLGGGTAPADGASAFDPIAFIKDGITGLWNTVSGAAGAVPGGAIGEMLMKIPPMLVNQVFEVVRKAAGAVGAFFGGTTAPGDLPGVKGVVQGVANRRGWGSGPEWNALDWLVNKESGWRPTAQNPTSTAFGLFQFLNGTWAGVGATKTADPAKQAEAGLAYIAKRYGTPSKAVAFHRRNNWYDGGGWLPSGFGTYVNGTGSPEPVLTNPQWADISSIALKLAKANKSGLLIPRSSSRLAAARGEGGTGGITESQLESVLDAVMERVKPHIEMNNTFNEKVDPKRISSQLAWELRS